MTGCRNTSSGDSFDMRVTFFKSSMTIPCKTEQRRHIEIVRAGNNGIPILGAHGDTYHSLCSGLTIAILESTLPSLTAIENRDVNREMALQPARGNKSTRSGGLMVGHG